MLLVLVHMVGYDILKPMEAVIIWNFPFTHKWDNWRGVRVSRPPVISVVKLKELDFPVDHVGY